MAIIITDKFQLRQKNFLDDRQGIASSVSALKSWDYSKVPIPEGFEVYVGGVWYIYRSSHPDDPTTGKFKTRTDSGGIDDLKVRVTRLEFEDGRDVASTFAEIKTEAFWKDSTGVSHARAGRIVTVTGDGDNNGPWYLISDDYTKTENWIKLIGRNDLVTTTGGATVSNTSVYTSSKTDATFPKKASPENITAEWVFKEDQVFEKDLTTDTIHALSGTIDTLDTTTGTITNLTSNNGNISNLTSGNATITEGTVTTLTSTNSTTTNQTVTESLEANNLHAITGTVDTLNSTNGEVTTLTSTTGNITNLTSDNANITEGTVTTLTSTNSTTTNQTVTGDSRINNLQATTGTVNTLNSTTGTITNLNSNNGNISNLTSGTARVDNGTITTLTSTNSTTTNQTVTGDSRTNNLQVTGNANFTGDTKLKGVEIGTNGSIKDESGKTVARVNRIVADESEIGDLDQKIRDQMGLIGVGNFLKNTSFAGEYDSLDLSNDSEVGGSTVVFNSKYDNWNVNGAYIVEDSDSVTGHSMRFDSGATSISQETVMSLNKGTSYILSWKQKGTVQVEVGSYELDVKTILTTSHYKYCYAKVLPTADRKELVVFSGGPGNVFEIKLEEGILPTSWFPSVLDTDPLADELYRFEYLRASFLDHPEGTDLTNSNIFLRNQIKLGDIINGEVTDIYGGISGVVSNGNDVMIWSGSSYEKATELLSHIENDSSYLDTLTPAQLKDLTKSIITLNYKTIFTDLYAVGKFKGKHLDEEGGELCSYPRLTGFLPSSGGKVGFTRGRLNKVNGSYPTSIDFGGTVINFNAGLCTTPEGQYTINTGSEISGITQLHLIFHEGYLTKISSVKDYNTTYYWY